MLLDFDFEKNDQYLLRTLVLDTKKFLKSLVFEENPFDYEILFIGGSKEYIERAMEEDNEKQFDKCIRRIAGTEGTKLSAAGLSGLFLKAKLGVLKDWWDLFAKGTWDAIKYIFAQLNALFGSIQAATGVGEAAKETKDLVANAIDYLNPNTGKFLGVTDH